MLTNANFFSRGKSYVAFASFALALSVGCDTHTTSTDSLVQTTLANLQTQDYLDVNAFTVIASGGGGNVYVTQVPRTEGKRHTSQCVRVISNTGQSAADLPLRWQRFASVLGEPTAVVSIRGLTTLSNGDLVLAVNGSTRARSLISLWVYNPRTDVLRLVADAKGLTEASGMGASLALADAEVVRAGRYVWVCLRTVDETVFLRIDTRELGAEKGPRLARPFQRLRLDKQTVTLLPDDRLAGYDDGTLWVLRQQPNDLYRISTDGRLLIENRPADLSPMLVPPLRATRIRPDGTEFVQILSAYSNEAPLAPGAPSVLPPGRIAAIQYPAFESAIENAPPGVKPTMLDRAAIKARPTFPLHALRITAWCMNPTTGEITLYDDMSGEVMRMTIEKK